MDTALVEYLFSQVDVAPSGTTCWLWRGPLNLAGYGQFWWRGQHMAPHRAAYELLVGPIPDGYQVDHLCRVRNCVRPSHLEAVTPAENRARAGQDWSGRTTCRRGHDITDPDNVWVHPTSGKRRCRVCQAERMARYQERHRS